MFKNLISPGTLQNLVFWVCLLLHQPVHLPLHGPCQRVHHAGHHPGQEESYHEPSLPKDNQTGGHVGLNHHLDHLHGHCLASHHLNNNTCNKEEVKVGEKYLMHSVIVGPKKICLSQHFSFCTFSF